MMVQVQGEEVNLRGCCGLRGVVIVLFFSPGMFSKCLGYLFFIFIISNALILPPFLCLERANGPKPPSCHAAVEPPRAVRVAS